MPRDYFRRRHFYEKNKATDNNEILRRFVFHDSIKIFMPAFKPKKITRA